MPLEFEGDAICLSGLTGSRLKCSVISEYYPFWWNITSGGPSQNYQFPTSIVELDAATGEVYIKDTKETILGSSGHALDLKCSNQPNTRNLKIILVEKDASCYSHLKTVIRRRWTVVNTGLAEGPITKNLSNIYLINKSLDSALADIDKLSLGNALFFFDPLRSVEYSTIEKVARKRISSFYRTGTEFIIFVFTSDWFLGRDDFTGLPTTTEETSWSEEQKKTVLEADSLLGNTDWRNLILTNAAINEREDGLIELYKNRLHKWFRYVLPLPFNPKANQIFHLILCSNYEIGVRATRNFYSGKTYNPKYTPDNKDAFSKFKKNHSDVFAGLSGNQRPLQWRILWKIVTEHEEGVCDCRCSDFLSIEKDSEKRQHLLEWLKEKGYLSRFNIENAWNLPVQQYKLNWPAIKEKLAIGPPAPLIPLSPKEIKG